MPRSSLQRRETEALEHIAESAEALAGSMKDMLARERECTEWLRDVLGLFRKQNQNPKTPKGKKFGNGGMRDTDKPRSLPPSGPGGVPALPMSENRRCINVTPSKSTLKEKE